MYLGLMAIFRNESHCIREFIEHYIHEGVDHFYLINNASEDNFHAEIEDYMDKITLLEENHVPDTVFLQGGGRQIEAYNEALGSVRTDWLMVVDLDEFAYAKNGYKNIRGFIRSHESSFEQHLMQLKPFTSGGVEKQPDSVVSGFTSGRTHMKATLTKSIAKTEFIKKIYINYCVLTSGARTVNGDLSQMSLQFNNKPELDKLLRFRYLDYDSQFDKNPIVVNHYSVQSKEWYFKVKATRGTSTWHGGEYQPASKWFAKRWDELNDVLTEEDETLKNIKESRKGGKHE